MNTTKKENNEIRHIIAAAIWGRDCEIFEIADAVLEALEQRGFQVSKNKSDA